MKKAIIVFLLFSVLAVSAFAQVSFSGSAYAGIQFLNPVGDGETITTDHREEGAPRFDFSATVLRENFGARLDTTFRMTEGADIDALVLNGIYGWVDFDDLLGNDLLRFTMGQISSTPWVLPRLHISHAEVEFGDVRGLRIDYTTPIQGLSAGAALRADGHGFQRSFERMVFGLTYNHHMFSAIFAYDLSANGQAIFGFNYTGILDLTAGFQLRAGHLASWSDDLFPGTLQLRQIVAYRVMRPLNVFLVASQSVENRYESDVGLEFIPGVEYRILPNLVGSFSAIIESPDHFSTTNLTLNPMIEKTLRGPAILYFDYQLRFDDMDTVTHTIGFGITIRAF